MLSLHFLRRSGVVAAAAAAKHLQWYTRGLDKPWPRYATERLLLVWWLLVDSLLSGAQRNVDKKMERAWNPLQCDTCARESSEKTRESDDGYEWL